MNPKYILLIILGGIHLIYTIRIQRKVSASILLNRKQKILNTVMIWLIPYIWYQLIKNLIHPNYEIMTKTKREQLKNKKGGGFYESGKGIH